MRAYGGRQPSWLERGVIKDNYQSVTLPPDTGVTVTLTVPEGKRWYVLCGFVRNGDTVTRAVKFYFLNSSSYYITFWYTANVSAGASVFLPGNYSGMCMQPVVLAAGQKIRIEWQAGTGGSGGTGTAAAQVIEVDENA